ncbi:hypothetical protein ACP4OV_017386 [Aristida adscensionis]
MDPRRGGATAAASTPPPPPPPPDSCYAPLPPEAADDGDYRNHREAAAAASCSGARWRACAAVLVAAGVVLLVVATRLAGVRMEREAKAKAAAAAAAAAAAPAAARSRGRDAGVSEKTSGAECDAVRAGAGEAAAAAAAAADGFPWSNAMLQWQRTGFHFQPRKNWMNDPNGPVYYRGWYHLFYQYNPSGAVWGRIAWGHAASRDLVHWRHLPLALRPDRWYDLNGVWTGSATRLPGGRLAVLYTGFTNASAQVQCLALPADGGADPLLRRWTKHAANPVLLPPPGVGAGDFRDPSAAWLDPSDGAWRVAIGSKDAAGAGVAMTYRTRDFVRYELVPGLLHRVPGTGMWECVDFYPVAAGGAAAAHGVDMSEAMAAAGDGGGDAAVVHVLKASMDDERRDYYALGRYDAAANRWAPVDAAADLGAGGLRYDWGRFYASKTFYDPAKRRRVLWGWVAEADSERADRAKGWASLQAIPRTVRLDTMTGANLLQWPVEEVEALRANSTDLAGATAGPGAVVPLDLRRATQLDILAEFHLAVDETAAHNESSSDVGGYSCGTGGGAAGRGALGPFGLLVLADARRREQTAVYFYVSTANGGGGGGRRRAHLCHDETRSSRAGEIVKRVVGGAVPVLEGEALAVRVVVDHSIVESFAMSGRAAVTSRVYPTEAIDAAAGVYLFNNATGASVTATRLVVHEMADADDDDHSAFMAPPDDADDL